MVWNSFCIWGSGTESFALCRCQLPIGEDSKSVLFARTIPTLCGAHTATLCGAHTVGGPHCHTVELHSQVCYSGKFSPSLACLQSSTRTAAVSVIKADRNQRGNNFLISKSDQDSIGRRQKRQGWLFVASPSLSKCSEPSLPLKPHSMCSRQRRKRKDWARRRWGSKDEVLNKQFTTSLCKISF